MTFSWGVDTLTGLGRIFEAVSLAHTNLCILTSRVSELDSWDDDLPIDEVQQLRESAARIKPISDQLFQLFAGLGENIHLSDHVCDNEYHEELVIDGKSEKIITTPQFNRRHLGHYASRLVTLLTKAENLAVDLNRQAQAIAKAKYPTYEIPGHDATVMNGYGEGHVMWIQQIDNWDDNDELSEVLQGVVNYSGEDASNFRYLRSYVEKEMQAIKNLLADTSDCSATQHCSDELLA